MNSSSPNGFGHAAWTLCQSIWPWPGICAFKYLFTCIVMYIQISVCGYVYRSIYYNLCGTQSVGGRKGAGQVRGVDLTKSNMPCVYWHYHTDFPLTATTWFAFPCTTTRTAPLLNSCVDTSLSPDLREVVKVCNFLFACLCRNAKYRNKVGNL